jgi:hypothetical protein
VSSAKGKQDLAPYLGPESEKEIAPDWDFYAKRTAATLARVTEVFGWGVNDLLQGSRAKTLFEGFDAKPEEEESPEPDGEDGETPKEAPVAKKAQPPKAPITTGKPKPVLDKEKKSLEDFF